MSVKYWPYLEENGVYHVYNRSVSGTSLFRNKSDYQYFIEQYKKFLGPYISTYAYCLIPNHFHFIIRVDPITDNTKNHIREEGTKRAHDFLMNELSYRKFISGQFERFFKSYSNTFNNKYGRHGSLFQKKFKRPIIKSKSELVYFVFYVLHNPIHHNITSEYIDYTNSAIHQYLGKEEWISTKPVLKLFANENDPEGKIYFRKALAYWKNRIKEMRGWMPDQGF